MAAHRSLRDVLTTIVDGLAAERGIALARIWLQESEELRLAASQGASILTGQRWDRLEGRASRAEIGLRKVGRVALERAALLLPIEADAAWLTNPQWAVQENIACFAGQPLLFRGDLLGVLAVFSRRMLESDEQRWLRLFADQAAAAIAHARDFAEIDRLSRQLSLENEALRQRLEAQVQGLAAGVRHEMNSPLTAILSSSQSLEKHADKSLDSADQVAQLAASITQAGEQLRQNIRKLTRFAELDRADLQMTSPVEGLRATCDVFERTLPPKVRLVRRLSEVPALKCRVRALNQLYLSLLQNAAEAIGDEGCIEVRAVQDNDEIRITVRDDGCGIADGDLPRLFELGFTTKRPAVGRGLGLAMARHVVKQHNGTLGLEHGAAGTIATVRLPAAD